MGRLQWPILCSDCIPFSRDNICDFLHAIFQSIFPMKTIALWLEFRFILSLWTRGEGYPNVSRSRSTICSHDDVIKWKHFPRYWSFVRGIHRSLVNSPHKAQWRGALMFSLICAWTNGWVNNRGAGDLRHHCAHYDVIVMSNQHLAHRHLLQG